MEIFKKSEQKEPCNYMSIKNSTNKYNIFILTYISLTIFKSYFTPSRQRTFSDG